MDPRNATHWNPYYAGGWFPWAHPNAAIASPSEWLPPQSTYGALPASSMPGLNIPPLSDPSKTRLSFRSQAGTARDLFVLGPGNRPVYRISGFEQETRVVNAIGVPVSRIMWQRVPLVEVGGQILRAADWLRPEPGTTAGFMTVSGIVLRWTFNSRSYFVQVPQAQGPVAKVDRVDGGVEIELVKVGLTEDLMNSIVTAVVLLQARAV